MYRSARVFRREWATVGKKNLVDRGGSPDQEFTALRAPDDLLVIAAGGPAGGFAAIVPSWFGARSLAVTKVVESV